jgi:hypothetical protein
MAERRSSQMVMPRWWAVPTASARGIAIDSSSSSVMPVCGIRSPSGLPSTSSIVRRIGLHRRGRDAREFDTTITALAWAEERRLDALRNAP